MTEKGNQKSPPYGDVHHLAAALLTDVDVDVDQHGVFLGSLAISLETSRVEYREMFEELLRVEMFSVDEAAAFLPDAVLAPLQIVDAPESLLRSHVPLPKVGTVEYADEGIFEIHRDAAFCAVQTNGNELQRILIVVRREEQDRELLLHCLMVVLYRALFRLGRVPLHAAAVDIADLGVCVFAGDKGTGKSTLSLHLGSKGHQVLAEDHIILREVLHSPGSARFFASGRDGRMRLTEKTERHFFTKPLDAEIEDVAGIAKKEVLLADLVPKAVPYQDRPISRLYFPSVGGPFKVAQLPTKEAVVRLLATVSERYRFVDMDDRLNYLDYFTRFASSVGCYDLELSSDLGDLRYVERRLRESKSRS